MAKSALPPKLAAALGAKPKSDVPGPETQFQVKVLGDDERFFSLEVTCLSEGGIRTQLYVGELSEPLCRPTGVAWLNLSRSLNTRPVLRR